MPNDLHDLPPDLHSERTRVDTAVYKEIPLGELSVDAQGRITIQRPAKPDARGEVKENENGY
ncbi:MAG: hypothetical protein ABSG67_18975 [Thermoguttaceae bacterium]